MVLERDLCNGPKSQEAKSHGRTARYAACRMLHAARPPTLPGLSLRNLQYLQNQAQMLRNNFY